jgi:hypothetical protein
VNAPALTSRWRLVTSAGDERAAEAAGASLLAGLLIGEPVDLSVLPYFKGGFQVEFVLTHEESWESAEAWLLSSVERTCVDWTQVDGYERELSVWSHALNIPRAEALEVVMTGGCG